MKALARLLALLLLATAVSLASASSALAAPDDDTPAICDNVVTNAVCEAWDATGGTALDAANAILHPGETVANIAGSAFEKMVGAMWDGANSALTMMLTWWLDIPAPSLYKENGYGLVEGPGSIIEKVQAATWPMQVSLAVLSMLVICIRLALARRQAAAEEAAEAGRSVGRMLLVALALPTVITITTAGGDAWASWIVNKAQAEDTLVETMSKLMSAAYAAGAAAGPGGAALGPGLALVFAIVLILAGLLQAFFMIIRNALLILACAALPLAASASGSATGRQAYQKLMAWVVAFLLFKPVAALCIAVGLWAGSDGTGWGAVAGLMLLAMSVLTLPALMRLIAPAVSAAGSGGSAAGAIAGGLAASGSVGALKGAFSSASKSSGSGPSGAVNVTGGGGSAPGAVQQPGGGYSPTLSRGSAAGSVPAGQGGARPAAAPSSTSAGASGAVPATSGTAAGAAGGAAAAVLAGAQAAASTVKTGARQLDGAANDAAGRQ